MATKTNPDAAVAPAAPAGDSSVPSVVKKKPSFFSRLRSYLFYDPLIWSYTIVLGILSVISSLFDRSGRVQHKFARLWSWLILKTIGAPVTVTGLDRIDTSKAHLYVANHISALDIPMLYVHLAFPFRIIAKSMIFRYPFVGWHLRRSGQIEVDKDNVRLAKRGLSQAVETLRSGMPLVVFPEGGRSPDGHLQPFLGGAFYAAIRAGVDVVPLALVGTFEMLPMDTYTIQPRPLELLAGEPISTQGLGPRDMDALAARAQRAVADLYYSHSDLPDPRTKN
jgi:1-acyl-sn-glycerol-3-phosphate acyltransferase